MSPGSAALKAAPSLALMTLLAGCAGMPDEEQAACPPVRIAVPADRIGFEDGEGELRFIAVMEDLVSDCREEDGDIEIDLALTMRAQRGPAFEEGPVELNYFLATVDPNREIVDKQVLDVALDFEPDQQLSSLREEVTIRLPASTEASGANYNLYLGFQLDG